MSGLGLSPQQEADAVSLILQHGGDEEHFPACAEDAVETDRGREISADVDFALHQRLSERLAVVIHFQFCIDAVLLKET